MDVFEAKIRGFHARAVENIMAKSSGFSKVEPREKPMKPKGDNITTYLRKFEIDRENLNLAKRILLCESEHDHKYYEREWKKTENFLRVRSNFKRGLSNEEPRIFKFQPIMGRGNCLVTLTFTRFQSSPVHFRTQNLYSLKALIKNSSVNPTNSNFTLNTLGNTAMSFYISGCLKKKKITCKISEIKQNEAYDRGKLVIDLSIDGQQEVEVINKQGKAIALMSLRVFKDIKAKKKDRKQENMNTSLCQQAKEKENDQFCENASQENI